MSVYILNALKTAGKQPERSIIKRTTKILLSDGGLKERFLKLKYSVVASFIGHLMK